MNFAVADKDNHRIQYISVNVQENLSYNQQYDSSVRTYRLIRSVGREGDQNGCFSYPWGVAWNRVNKMVAIADSKNHRIQFLDQNGNFLTSYMCNFGPMQHNLKFSPRGLNFVSSKKMKNGHDCGIYDRLVCSDFDSHKLVVLTFQAGNVNGGTKIPQFEQALTVGSFGKSSGKFDRPQGVMKTLRN